MSGYRYQITVTPLTDNKGAPRDEAPFIFETENHDDILMIERLMQQNPALEFNSKAEVSAFAVGLKLFSEVMLKNRKNPLFEPLQEGFMAFMKELKATVKKD